MFEFIAQHFYLGLLLTIYLGLLLGSLTTAIIYRTLSGQSWIWNKGRAHGKAQSYCPSCKHTLTVLDLVPVFSYLFQKGKCRYCKAPIGRQYILTEMAVVVFCVVIFIVFDEVKIQLSLMLLTPFIYSQISVFITNKILSKLLVGIILFGLFIMFCLIY